MLLLSPYSVDVVKTDALSNVYSSFHLFSYITISLLIYHNVALHDIVQLNYFSDYIHAVDESYLYC